MSRTLKQFPCYLLQYSSSPLRYPSRMSSAHSDVQATSPSTLDVRHIPSSPYSPASHSWKFLLRRPASKKLAASTNINGPLLTLDTDALSSPVNPSLKSPITPNTSLTPRSILSAGQRSSSNSSNTRSTDSNVGRNTNPYPTQSQRPHTSYLQQQPSLDALSADVSKLPRKRTKSEKHTRRTTLVRSGTSSGIVQSAQPSQTSFNPRSTLPTSRQLPPRSPSKSMGALPRFIRRVASAPNAKDIFSPKRSSTTTKNGFLAPSEDIPPVPALPTTSSEQGTEPGTDSLETTSSGSSRSRPVRGHTSMPNVDGRGTFRRTYSSNSIKIRSVSSFYASRSLSANRPSGRGRSVEFLEDQVVG